ncbi:hypothetical protein [Sphaerisporangium perillae]|uniref:hypothetical protein n=1 Tax=Sphaerisporangium perillae TaxID=2935860 RepID=UPI00200D5A6D|nr:hypothetical protein [Sphaerisporangium perillae]
MQRTCTELSATPETDSPVNPPLTPQPARRVVENDEYAEFLQRIIRAYGRRIAAGDVEALADAVALIEELDDAIVHAVTGLRGKHGYSWADIARPLAITRQAAQQRWGGEPS